MCVCERETERETERERQRKRERERADQGWGYRPAQAVQLAPQDLLLDALSPVLSTSNTSNSAKGKAGWESVTSHFL